jgi:hypothetical protein
MKSKFTVILTWAGDVKYNKKILDDSLEGLKNKLEVRSYGAYTRHRLSWEGDAYDEEIINKNLRNLRDKLGIRIGHYQIRTKQSNRVMHLNSDEN